MEGGEEEGTEADHQCGMEGGERGAVGDMDEAGRYSLSTTCECQRSSHLFSTYDASTLVTLVINQAGWRVGRKEGWRAEGNKVKNEGRNKKIKQMGKKEKGNEGKCRCQDTDVTAFHAL